MIAVCLTCERAPASDRFGFAIGHSRLICIYSVIICYNPLESVRIMLIINVSSGLSMTCSVLSCLAAAENIM